MAHSWKEFFVNGLPAPKGSMSAFTPGSLTKAERDKYKQSMSRNISIDELRDIAHSLLVSADRRTILAHNNKRTKSWQQQISLVAMTHKYLISDKAFIVDMIFYLRRPGSARSRASPHVKPDIDKLARVVLDALEGIAYTNDSRVVKMRVEKSYADSPGAEGVLIRTKEISYEGSV